MLAASHTLASFPKMKATCGDLGVLFLKRLKSERQTEINIKRSPIYLFTHKSLQQIGPGQTHTWNPRLNSGFPRRVMREAETQLIELSSSATSLGCTLAGSWGWEKSKGLNPGLPIGDLGVCAEFQP